MRTETKQMASRRSSFNGHGLGAVPGAVRALCALALMLSVFDAAAADVPPRAADRPVAATLHSEVVKPGLYRIESAAGTSLMRVGSKGLILVDAHRASSYGELMAEVRQLAKVGQPAISAVVLTAAAQDQMGRLAPFVSASVPVIVQRRALAQLAPQTRSSGPGRRPYISYDTDYQLSVADIQAEIEHVGSGRTGADSVVFFRDLRVLAVGDLYTDGTPAPDCASGGSFAGWAAAIAHLMYFDFDVAVPNRGATVGKRELLALKDRLEMLAAHAGSPAALAAACRPPK